MDSEEIRLTLTELVNLVIRNEFRDPLRTDKKEGALAAPLDEISDTTSKISEKLGCLLSFFYTSEDTIRKKNLGLEWYTCGRNNIKTLFECVESIDWILKSFITILDREVEDLDGDMVEILDKVEFVCDQLLNLKEVLFNYKKKMDLSISCNELGHIIMKTIIDEIEDCDNVANEIFQLTSQQEKQFYENLSLAEIANKLRVSSFVSSVPTKTVRLPIFNESDKHLYDSYYLLETRVTALEASLSYLPYKLEDFFLVCSLSIGEELYQKSVDEVKAQHTQTTQRWKLFHRKWHKLRSECYVTKWNEILNCLVTKLIQECERLMHYFDTGIVVKDVLIHEVGPSFKACSNNLKLISRALTEGIVTDSMIFKLFDEDLSPKWQNINHLFSSALEPKEKPAQSLERQNNFEKEKNFKVKDCHHLAGSYLTELFSKKPDSTGGIDLRLDVESTKLPLSVKKNDRVIDIVGKEAVSDNKKSLQRNLENAAKLDEDEFKWHADDDDESTLVVSKGYNYRPDNDDLLCSMGSLKISDPVEDFGYLNYLLEKSEPIVQCRLPIICENYIRKGFPMIKKNLSPDSIPCRIPSISPLHPIFYSKKASCSPHFHSPYRLEKPYFPKKNYFSEDVKEENPFTEPKKSATVPTRMSSLSSTTTPDLLYRLPSSYGDATSPEISPSEFGSRILVQAKSLKF